MKIKEMLPENDHIITEECLYEMARIKPSNSGLPQVMYASDKETAHDRHAPRIKISNIPNTFSKEDNFVVTIEHEPRIVAGKTKYQQNQLNDIFDWIKLNYIPLLKYWNNKYDNDADFYAELIKL